MEMPEHPMWSMVTTLRCRHYLCRLPDAKEPSASLPIAQYSGEGSHLFWPLHCKGNNFWEENTLKEINRTVCITHFLPELSWSPAEKCITQTDWLPSHFPFPESPPQNQSVKKITNEAIGNDGICVKTTFSKSGNLLIFKFLNFLKTCNFHV